MRQFFYDIALFNYTVLSYWQAYVTGGAVVVIVTLVERLTSYRLKPKVYVATFVGAAFIVAFFLAWRDQLNTSLQSDPIRSLPGLRSRPIASP
jgi:hypothetical protein